MVTYFIDGNVGGKTSCIRAGLSDLAQRVRHASMPAPFMSRPSYLSNLPYYSNASQQLHHRCLTKK